MAFRVSLQNGPVQDGHITPGRCEPAIRSIQEGQKDPSGNNAPGIVALIAMENAYNKSLDD